MLLNLLLHLVKIRGALGFKVYGCLMEAKFILHLYDSLEILLADIYWDEILLFVYGFCQVRSTRGAAG